MLLEHINHYNNLHFAMNFTNVSEEPPHYHKEMELALILRGYARYKVHHQDFMVKAGEIVVVDTQALHYIYESSDDMIMLQFHVDMAYFSDEYPNIDVMFFVCEESENEGSQWQHRFHNTIAFLAQHIAEMMILCQQGGNDGILKDKLREFLYIMVDKFQAFFIENKEFHYVHEVASPIDFERLYRIMHFLYVNYDKKITLGDIAGLEHLSIHYISHFIKKTSGLSFQNLLNYIRLEQAEKLLNENKYTLTHISEACGFSSTAYFNKCFKSWYGITPSEYKKQLRPSGRLFHEPFSKSEALLLLQDYLNTDLPSTEELEGGYSINHLVIPVLGEYENKKKVKDAFPLEILIDDAKSLQRSVYYADDLARLHPDRIIIPDKVVSACDDSMQMLEIINSKGLYTEVISEDGPYANIASHASNTARAFACATDEPKSLIRLFDDTAGLFTMNGLPSPYHTLFTLLDDIGGDIAEKNDNYLIIKSKDHISLIIHNCDAAADLNVHVQLDPSDKPEGIIKRRFSSKDNIYSTLNAIRYPDKISQSMRKYLPAITAGTTEFISLDDKPNYRFDFAIEPEMLVAVHIY